MKSLLSLCDYSGEWSKPFLVAGWEVVRLDKAYPNGVSKLNDGSSAIGIDVRHFKVRPERFDAIIAAPPCTCFCRPSARWWKRQDADGSTVHDIEVFRACLTICKTAKEWWALENPPGRHQKLIPELGPSSWQYQPFHYGDPWIKQTYIWGTARYPWPTDIVQTPPTRRTPNGKTQGRIAFMSSSWKRKREQTPSGFANAFFKAQALTG